MIVGPFFLLAYGFWYGLNLLLAWMGEVYFSHAMLLLSVVWWCSALRGRDVLLVGVCLIASVVSSHTLDWFEATAPATVLYWVVLLPLHLAIGVYDGTFLKLESYRDMALSILYTWCVGFVPSVMLVLVTSKVVGAFPGGPTALRLICLPTIILVTNGDVPSVPLILRELQWMAIHALFLVPLSKWGTSLPGLNYNFTVECAAYIWGFLVIIQLVTRGQNPFGSALLLSVLVIRAAIALQSKQRVSTASGPALGQSLDIEEHPGHEGQKGPSAVSTRYCHVK